MKCLFLTPSAIQRHCWLRRGQPVSFSWWHFCFFSVFRYLSLWQRLVERAWLKQHWTATMQTNPPCTASLLPRAHMLPVKYPQAPRWQHHFLPGKRDFSDFPLLDTISLKEDNSIVKKDIMSKHGCRYRSITNLQELPWKCCLIQLYAFICKMGWHFCPLL